MKTKNNVQKTILRFAAVVFSFVLISFTVSAQDFWKKLIAGSSFNEIALAMVDHSKEANYHSDSAHASFNFVLDNEKDEPMTLEPWMMNKDFYGETTTVVSNEIEAPLQVEPWMLNEKLFEVQNAEEGLKLEEWMVSDRVWK